MSILIAQTIGLIIAVAWFFPSLASSILPSDWHLMTLSTSISVLAAGFAIRGCRNKGRVWLQRSFAIFFTTVLMLGAASLLHIFTGDLTQLSESPVGQYWRPMAVQTSIGLALIVFAAFAIKHDEKAEASDLLLIVSLMFNAMLTLGYLSALLPIVGQTLLIRTSPHTLIALWLLWYGLLELRVQNQSMADYFDGFVSADVKQRTRNLLDALKRACLRIMKRWGDHKALR